MNDDTTPEEYLRGAVGVPPVIPAERPTDEQIERAGRAWAEVAREQTNAGIRRAGYTGDVGGWDDYDDAERETHRSRIAAALGAAGEADLPQRSRADAYLRVEAPDDTTARLPEGMTAEKLGSIADWIECGGDVDPDTQIGSDDEAMVADLRSWAAALAAAGVADPPQRSRADAYLRAVSALVRHGVDCPPGSPLAVDLRDAIGRVAAGEADRDDTAPSVEDVAALVKQLRRDGGRWRDQFNPPVKASFVTWYDQAADMIERLAAAGEADGDDHDIFVPLPPSPERVTYTATRNAPAGGDGQPVGNQEGNDG